MNESFYRKLFSIFFLFMNHDVCCWSQFTPLKIINDPTLDEKQTFQQLPKTSNRTDGITAATTKKSWRKIGWMIGFICCKCAFVHKETIFNGFFFASIFLKKHEKKQQQPGIESNYLFMAKIKENFNHC